METNSIVMEIELGSMSMDAFAGSSFFSRKVQLRVVLFFPSPHFFPLGFSWEGEATSVAYLYSYAVEGRF